MGDQSTKIMYVSLTSDDTFVSHSKKMDKKQKSCGTWDKQMQASVFIKMK